MTGWYRRWRRKRSINKVKPGDGHELKPYRFYQILSRSLFYAKLPGEDGGVHTYAVSVDYFGEEDKADLYCDRKHIAGSALPAIFPVPGGFIEVGVSTYGLTRMHYVTVAGEEKQLYPDKNSAEGLRMRLHRTFPALSKLMGAAAVIILLLSILLGLPQLIEFVSGWDMIKERFGTFNSPISLPDWLNTALVTAGILAAMERALMLRSHWLIDMETTWWDSIG